MDRKIVDEKIDLLMLPPSERLRVCKEIRAALKERVSEAKISFTYDAIDVDETMIKSSEWENTNKNQKVHPLNNSSQNPSSLTSLLKRIW